MPAQSTSDQCERCIMWQIFSKKLDAEVLHSSTSIRKWSKTSKVKAVCGWVVLAGNNLAFSNCKCYWQSTPGQLHQTMLCKNTPVECTMVNLVDIVGPWTVFIGGKSASLSIRIFSHACMSSENGHGCPPWPICQIKPNSSSNVSLKHFPVHSWTLWKGKNWWALTMQEQQNVWFPLQVKQRNFPSPIWQDWHWDTSESFSKLRRIFKYKSQKGRYPWIKSFCVWS